MGRLGYCGRTSALFEIGSVTLGKYFSFPVSEIAEVFVPCSLFLQEFCSFGQLKVCSSPEFTSKALVQSQFCDCFKCIHPETHIRGLIYVKSFYMVQSKPKPVCISGDPA